MPLKLIPPREGKTPYWSVRGTYLGRYVDRSTKARKRALATKILNRWCHEIERGEYAEAHEPTFADAALTYMRAGGERAFLRPLIEHFRNAPLRQISQAAIDALALDLYPNATPGTRNRQVYTPISAVLKHAGIDTKLRRPKGGEGRSISAFLWPAEAAKLTEAARALDPEFALLVTVLLYTGLRLGEALALRADNVRLNESFAYVPVTKNSDPRAVYLPAPVTRALEAHTLRPGGRVFRFAKSGHIYHLLRAAAARAGVTMPRAGGLSPTAPYLRDLDAALWQARHERISGGRRLAGSQIGRPI